MRKLLIALLVVALAAPAFARDVDAFVSADWLEANLSNARVVVLDVRKVEDYKAGHIPGAVNALGLYVAAGDLANEVPPLDDLSELLAEAGVAADSIVVVVEADGSRLTYSTRVAWTLVYAGIPNVAILDGGYAAWTKAAKAVSTEFATRDETDFAAKPVDGFIASKAYVLANLKKAQFLDARDYPTYFGETKPSMVTQFGHIPGATGLPYTWITADGLVRPKADLQAIVAALKLDAKKELITYCNTGVLATTWWWVLSQHLGWTKVRSYDGSAQEISKEPGVTFTRYTWK